MRDTSVTRAPRNSERVLVLGGRPRDARLAAGFLRPAGIDADVSDSPGSLLAAMRHWELGAVVIAEEAVDAAALEELKRILPAQPKWSDLPVILFTSGSGQSIDKLLVSLGGNVTALERPVRSATLITAVRTALRARRRQYELRDVLSSMEAAQRRLEEQDRRKDEFLAMLGHELRNPLASIISSVHVMQHAPEAETQARTREIIQRQARHLARLVDDLLDVSRVTLGKIALERKPVDLCEVAARCVQTFQLPAAAAQHELRLERCEEALVVEGDQVRLDQVLSNLVSNAIKYTPLRGHIKVTVRREHGTAVLGVDDDGIGMESELVPKVFDLFMQGTPTLDRARGGLGLGLSLVKSLVERHGGQVEARSEGRGKGSRFTVKLPLADDLSPPSAAEAPAESPGAAGVNVLVVEDNDDARETLQLLLEAWGYRVQTAADGWEGLEKVLAVQPDVAIVDIGLPKLNGYEVARRVRAHMDESSPRLIAVTGYGQPEDRRRALEAGFDHHLAKPVRADELSRLLRAASVNDANQQAPGAYSSS
jgi:signal transduction histidine kinase/ActR/RegA family two-component response regulator